MPEVLIDNVGCPTCRNLCHLVAWLQITTEFLYSHHSHLLESRVTSESKTWQSPAPFFLILGSCRNMTVVMTEKQGTWKMNFNSRLTIALKKENKWVDGEARKVKSSQHPQASRCWKSCMITRMRKSQEGLKTDRKNKKHIFFKVKTNKRLVNYTLWELGRWNCEAQIYGTTLCPGKQHICV